MSALNKEIPNTEEAINLNKAITAIPKSILEKDTPHRLYECLGVFSWKACQARSKFFTRMVDAAMKNKTDEDSYDYLVGQSADILDQVDPWDDTPIRSWIDSFKFHLRLLRRKKHDRRKALLKEEKYLGIDHSTNLEKYFRDNIGKYDPKYR